MLRKIMVVAAVTAVLSACQQPQDVNGSSGGAIDAVQQTTDPMKALAAGEAAVCADQLLHQTVLAIIGENLNMAFNHETLRRVYENEVQSVMSGTDSYIRGFDQVTKVMQCETNLVSTLRGETYQTPITWSVQPTADGSDMNVLVDFNSFHSRRLELAMAMWRADEADTAASAPPPSPEPYIPDAAAAPIQDAAAAPTS